MSQGIFNGLKVLDCASFIAGPAAGTILSDFGADVIKIEPPGKGDPHRSLYALEPNPKSKRNYFWQQTNRNKRGLALNLKSPAAVGIMKKLLSTADVFIINYPPHVRQALGLAYENIRMLNPKIIYADITGYGEEGPEADKPGFDLTAYWARTGLMDSTRNEGSPPTIPVSGIGDHATASTLYGAIVTGLYRREKSGLGCKVSTSLIGEGAWAASGWIKAALDGASVSGPATDREKPHNALANTYKTSDGRWLILTFVGEDKDWPGLVKALERPDLLTDPRFVDSAHRLTQIQEESSWRGEHLNSSLHTELWTSFASMIRSYGAAQGLNSRHQAIVEVGSDVILLRVGTRWLRITPSEMTEDNDRTQPFQLNEDGTVTVGTVTEDMDFTAERLTRELMQ